MFIEEMRNKFGYNIPIFTNEILELFSQYTKAYVFRMINEAEEKQEIVQLDTGVYYLPQITPFGLSVITASDVAKKKYIQNQSEIYGIYSGLTLQNEFSLTTQMTNMPEIVSNRASSRCRRITIDGMDFVLRKARTKITADNVKAYRVLQLFTEIKCADIGKDEKRRISDYIKTNGLSQGELIDLAKNFPAKTLQNLTYSGVLYEIT